MVTSDPLPTVVAEEVLLMQLFQNLISNSIKYRGKETPRIHVSAERDGEGWLFAVRDNGIGIDPQDADRVFGMFKRLHGSEIPGTGHRSGDLQESGRAPGRTNLGGIGTGHGRYVQVHHSLPAHGVINGATPTKCRAEEEIGLRKQLDRANADFEEFVSMAAHNLRESLRDVASFSQLMAETYAGRLDSEAGAFLARIQEGAAKHAVPAGRRGGLLGHGRRRPAILPDGHGSGPSPGAALRGQADHGTERCRHP